ncbi:MAG: class I SAM-dependent methyltransferase [Saprospiraceae bacterium]|nr:class I SAM-dependent methyltransferase [Saprospiraceae bacterium]
MHDFLKPGNSSSVRWPKLFLDRFSMLCHFYRVSQTRYDIHSSFLHQLYTKIEDTEKEYYSFRALEEERQILLKNHLHIRQGSWGALSTITSGNTLRIAQIAKWGISSPSKCRLLFSLALYFQPAKILELGTSLGLSSAYLSAADHRAEVVTIEANQELVKFAKQMHQRLGYHSIDCRQGLFMEVIPKVSQQADPWDMIYIDGHHDEHSTMSLFELLLPYTHEDTILIFDDIYWSKGMARAWQNVVAHKNTTLCIDLFHTGIVFFQKNLSKEYKALIPYMYKPWRIGLF